MRVAMLSCVYPPYGGGIGEVARQYAALLSAEHQVTVITPRYYPGMTFAATPGVAIEPRRPFLALGKAAWLPGLRHRLKEFDAVHLHYPFFGAQERLHHLPARLKLVLSYHMLPEAGGAKGALMRWSLRWSDKRLAQRANLLICATRDYLEAVAQPRLGEPTKWHVLPFGVDARFAPGEPSEVLEHQIKLRYGECALLFVGTLDPAHAFKGLGVLLQAVGKLRTANWRLVVVGGGKLKQHYEREARRLGLKDRVHFAGYVAEAQLPDYYHLANVFVFPSLGTGEAFGLAALQAMACGLPVVASRLTGVR
ncbi:MAG: glycosyltransferase family 4 protein, partial [Candidatus Veblenbacteria bacterium]|nr:glycosyltransferase family 4 protein [Candidatus Veblenbacteria bacterium]